MLLLAVAAFLLDDAGSDLFSGGAGPPELHDVTTIEGVPASTVST